MPLSVLIVEDNSDAADSLADLLRLCGHEAQVARNGDQAFKAADGRQADVVVMDIVLPDTDGYTAAKRLRGLMGRVPLMIALTGFEAMETWSRAEGFDHHFVKPMDPSILIEILRKHEERLAARP